MGTKHSFKIPCLVFIRHGEAVRQRGDHKRSLSEKGRLQALKCADNLALIPFDLIISSSAKRAAETAEIIRRRNCPEIAIEIIPELYLPVEDVDKQAVLHMLNDLGPVSLDCFIEQDHAGAWKRYSEGAYKAFAKAIKKYASQNILIVAHANIINDLGLRFAPRAKELLSTYFGHCEGFLINRDGKVKFL